MENVLVRNGKTLQEALAAVSEPKIATRKKEDGDYYDIGEYMERMEQAFGRGNFIANYEYVPPLMFNTGQVMLQCKCHIDIIGMSGEVVYSCEGLGGWEIKRTKSTRDYINLTTVTMNCDTIAFKAACKEMRIFDCRNGSETNKKANSNAGSGTSSKKSSSSPKSSAEIKNQRFYLRKPLELLWRDKHGKPAYKMLAYRCINDSVDERESQILIYPNQYKNSTENLNKLIARSQETQSGFKVTLGVSELNNSQGKESYAASYLFKNFGEEV